METLHSITKTKNNKLLWTLPYIFVAVGLLFAFIGLSEFYNIKIAGKETNYPFGSVNDNPWYYKSSSTYATYNLTSGLLFLTASLVTIWATIKKSRMPLILGTTMTIMFFIAELISSKIQ